MGLVGVVQGRELVDGVAGVGGGWGDGGGGGGLGVGAVVEG